MHDLLLPCVPASLFRVSAALPPRPGPSGKSGPSSSPTPAAPCPGQGSSSQASTCSLPSPSPHSSSFPDGPGPNMEPLLSPGLWVALQTRSVCLSYRPATTSKVTASPCVPCPHPLAPGGSRHGSSPWSAVHWHHPRLQTRVHVSRKAGVGGRLHGDPFIITRLA